MAYAAVPGRLAHADDAPPLRNRDYALEIFQGPLIAPGRITGLGGATAAQAQSLEGVYNNAAAPAVREPISFDHFEWEPTAGIAFPGAYGGTDFSNRGERGIARRQERNQQLGLVRNATVETTDNFLYLNAGLWGQIGNLGVTVTADMLRYDIADQSADQARLSVGVTRMHAVAAYGFWRNQVCIGGGVRLAYVDIRQSGGTDGQSFGIWGVGPQVGAIVKPESMPWRVGLTVRGPVSSEVGLTQWISRVTTDSSSANASVQVPSRIVQPFEIEAGVAYQLGPRPLNPAWIDPRVALEERRADVQRARAERQRSGRRGRDADTFAGTVDIKDAERELELRAEEDATTADLERRIRQELRARYLNWPREHVLLLASLVAAGPSSDAVALEGFIEQRRELVGQAWSLSPRFAVESEVIANLLKTRAGGYVEPSRFSDGTARQHFTLGFDVRLFSWSVFGLFPDRQWRLSAFLDLAERYENFGVGVGTWH